MKDEAIYRRLFRTALLIRLVEERIIELYPSDKIQSPVHLSIGQEAVAVGVCDGLKPDDLVFATYRSHGFYIAKGGSLDAMFAELYGRKGGVSGGKAGSMHLAAPEVGLMGSSAVVASTIPHAVGAALSFKRRGALAIAVAVFGDGATEEGVYHESLNFAALMKVPVLFLCEDNGLAVHSHRPVRQSYRLAEHAASFGIASAAGRGGLGHAGDPPGHARGRGQGAGGRAVRARDRHVALQGACRRRRGLPLQLSHQRRRRCLEAPRSADRRRQAGRGAAPRASNARSRRPWPSPRPARPPAAPNC